MRNQEIISWRGLPYSYSPLLYRLFTPTGSFLYTLLTASSSVLFLRFDHYFPVRQNRGMVGMKRVTSRVVRFSLSLFSPYPIFLPSFSKTRPFSAARLCSCIWLILPDYRPRLVCEYRLIFYCYWTTRFFPARNMGSRPFIALLILPRDTLYLPARRNQLEGRISSRRQRTSV